jgi:hypothetical protein
MATAVAERFLLLSFAAHKLRGPQADVNLVKNRVSRNLCLSPRTAVSTVSGPCRVLDTGLSRSYKGALVGNLFPS